MNFNLDYKKISSFIWFWVMVDIQHESKSFLSHVTQIHYTLESSCGINSIGFYIACVSTSNKKLFLPFCSLHTLIQVLLWKLFFMNLILSPKFFSLCTSYFAWNLSLSLEDSLLYTKLFFLIYNCLALYLSLNNSIFLYLWEIEMTL